MAVRAICIETFPERPGRAPTDCGPAPQLDWIAIDRLVIDDDYQREITRQGRRVSRPNPESEWMRADAPDLAIVDPQTLAAARARKGANAGQRAPSGPRRTPRSPLSGLLKCGACGGGMSKHDRNGGRPRVRCSRAHESGDCANARPVYLDRIEDGVLARTGGNHETAERSDKKTLRRARVSGCRRRKNISCRDRDAPIAPMVTIAKTLCLHGHRVIIITGRSDECREATREWVDLFVWPGLPIYMRRAGDHRDDDIVKPELFAEARRDGFEIVQAFEDRARVVDAALGPRTFDDDALIADVAREVIAAMADRRRSKETER